MKLKDLVKKLRAKPNQNEDVEFIVYEKSDGEIVCAEMLGPALHQSLQRAGER